MMDNALFIDMLNIDSTSGRERAFADFLAERLLTERNELRRFDVESMASDVPEGCAVPQNLLFSWGVPQVIFCTHLDTVPPYISPHVSEGISLPNNQVRSDTQIRFSGRGTCDAKGQIFSMWEACRELEAKGYDGFGLLLLAGEETGSFGAKSFDALMSDDASFIQSASSVIPSDATDLSLHNRWLIVGEPTDNCMATASKGTKSFEVTFAGKAFHSGYPEYGLSAVEMFNDFMNALRSIRFPYDEVLGDTTFNIGKLHSDNPQNILSPSLTCRVYFRTTFESDEIVCNVMKNIAGPDARLRFGRPKAQDGSDIVAKDIAPWQVSMSVKAFGGDSPTKFETFEGFEKKPVSFGSDAPQLHNFKHKILCGPGSILVAHRPDEHILLSDIETAVSNYVKIFEHITNDKL